MRLLVINNKRSGLGENAVYDFLRILCDEGDEAVVRTVNLKVPVAELLHDAEDYDLVVASGGDGTVTSICYELRYRGIPVLPFPAGTSNLLAMNLTSPSEPRALAAMTRNRITEDYDLGELSYTDDEGNERRNGFAIMAGAGYDAMIMDGATGLKGILGNRAYYVSALTGDKPKKAKIILRIDGKEVHTSGIAVILVNFAKIAPGISVTHVNDAQDGLLEAVVLKPDNRLQLAPALMAAILDGRGQYPSRSDAMEVYAGHSIEVETIPPLPIQYDGELAHAHTPMSASSLPGALKAIIDEEELVRLETMRLLDSIEDE